jgi:hypothetical protein
MSLEEMVRREKLGKVKKKEKEILNLYIYIDI